jgi:biotin transport system substrate-specific component
MVGVNILKKELIKDKIICDTIGVISFIILTSLGAFVRIPLPFTPVPITLQTFFVLLSGAVLGAKLGAFSQIGYIFLGALGLPIFQGGGSGLIHLLGPTGGYLIGFILSSWTIGRITGFKNNLRFSVVFVSMIVGAFLILLFGSAHLALILHCDLKRALFLGFFPFVPGDIVKSIIASSLYVKLQNRVREIF